MSNEPPQLIVADAVAWRTWLASHHENPTGVWLILAKKGTAEPTSLTYDQALDEALCQGWIVVRPGAATKARTNNASPHAVRGARGPDATWASWPDWWPRTGCRRPALPR